MNPVTRRARPGDAEVAARLVHESAGGLYDRFAGGPERALGVLRKAFARPGSNASAEVIWVAELDGEVVAAMAAFPVEQTRRRARAFLNLTLRSLPPWRWPATLGLYYAGTRAAPAPAAMSLYVDALATDAGRRRRGAAHALLEAAAERARSLGLRSVSIDTGIDNSAARALYRRAGFEEVASRPGSGDLPGFVALVRQLG
ncbi:MAG: GNAT family N-acetyltransferase [Actinomycetota bacterium]|nr:GNAT family N-acetyltransferase [Actinomycetota bacterium]